MPRPRTKNNGEATQAAPAAADMIAAPVQVEPAPSAEAARTSTSEPIDPQFVSTLEAVLFSTDKPLPVARLAAVLGLVDDEESETAPAEAARQIRGVIGALNEHYDKTARSFRIELVAGGYRVMTRPEFADAVARLHRARIDGKLSRAALETLAIVAYRQPMTRADLEAIRGVACGEVLRSLMERRLVTITGRAEELGRPMLYGTTRQFLENFGLASLKDLPTLAELKAP